MDTKVNLNSIKHSNQGKRRKRNLLSDIDRQAMFLRNSGIPYVRKNGTEVPEKSAPIGGKICNRCTKPGCAWDEAKKKMLFDLFWSPNEDNHNQQSSILANCIRWTVPAEITYFNICMHSGYFTEVNQKFLASGHSFLPCDRQFAIMERKMKIATIYEPEDIINAIREASPDNPFIIQRMFRNDFKSLAILQEIIPRPMSLKVSQMHWLQMSTDRPSQILTKRNYINENVWTVHDIVDPFNVGVPRNQRLDWDSYWIEGVTFLEEYTTVVPISAEKIRGLRQMLPYIPANRQAYLLQVIADNEPPLPPQ